MTVLKIGDFSLGTTNTGAEFGPSPAGLEDHCGL